MSKSYNSIASIALLVLLLGGCGPQVLETANSEDSFPVGGKVYATVEELRDDYVSAGGECPFFDRDSDPTIGATSSGICRMTDDTESWISSLAVFPDSSSLNILIELQNETMGLDEIDETWSRVVGANWLISKPSDTSVLLGGALQTGID